MRSTFSTVLFCVAAVSIYLFATGATYPPWRWGETEFLERILAPFQVFSFFSGALVLTGVAAFLLSLICFECEDKYVSDATAKRSWSTAGEVAFVLNVGLVGALLGILWFRMPAANAMGSASDGQEFGMLFGTGLLEAVLGTVLAVVLFFLAKRRALYFSLLVAHVAEVITLGTIFFFGTNI